MTSAAARPLADRPLRRLWRYADGFRGRIALATTFSVLNKVFDLAPPLLIGAAVDVVVKRDDSLLASLGWSDPYTQLYVLAAITVTIWVLESITEYIHKVLWRNLAQEFQHVVRDEAYGHVQNLELRWFEDQSTGGLMAILNDDVNQLERFLNIGANDLAQMFTTVTVIGAIFFSLDPSVASLAFIPIPLVIWGSLAFQKRIAPRYVDVRERVAQLNGQLANNLGGIATIKSFTAEEHERARIATESSAYQQSNRRAIALSSAFSPLIRMIIVCGFTATLILGGKHALNGALAVGAFSTMVFMTQRLLWPLTRLGETFDLYQRAMASATRILDLLGTQPTITSGDKALPKAEVAGLVEFEHVVFGYDPGHPVLHGLSLAMPPGETTAIVGATGAGKSTIVKLLLRLYDVDSGAVRVDGVDVRQLELRALREAIGLVSQDVFLFHGTVRENVAYGRRDAGFEELVEAARVAEALEFIEALPQGWETIVGERGQKLSGGQRQRLSIARAVLKDPPILVLDEATSSVDNETEAAIQRSLETLAVGRTTIVIAHRLSTVRNAHRIYTLENGRLAEVGRHEELLDQDGLYAALWRVQTGEALTAR